jgi:hypothetical protein
MCELAAYPLEFKQNRMGGNLEKYVAILNDICKWTSALLLWHRAAAVSIFHVPSFGSFHFRFSLQERSKMMEFFMVLCDELLKIRNYQICIAIAMALQSTPIRRLIIGISRDPNFELNIFLGWRRVGHSLIL